MLDRRSLRALLSVLALVCCGGLVSAVVGAEGESDTPIATVLAEVDADVRVYNDHLVTLASPFMEGRVPGSRGMAIATEYMEYYFKEAGLEAAFPVTETAADGTEVITPRASYRQPFPLGGTTKVSEAYLARTGEEASTFVAGEDFTVTGMGGSGEVTGPITFVGYSIDDGNDGYSSYAEGDDLSGKVALMLRFEPMNQEGKSTWSDNGRWTGRASFANKLRAVSERNPAAVIMVNTPGADDPRIGELMSASGRSRGGLDVPVLMMSAEAADRLIGGGEDGRPTLLELRRVADIGRVIVDFDVEVTIRAKTERESLKAENVGGLLPGRGDLADELIVVGAHLDHLGMGYFGSRSGPGELHPGADDNASGSAGIILLADKLVDSYAALPEDADARTVLFIGFSGEESGLNGSRYYVENPIVPVEQHVLMTNFDMIGRIQNRRLSVSGGTTGDGLAEWLGPFFEASPLEVVVPERLSGASDHSSFMRRQIPVIFGIIADFHGDYHTPRDVSSLINRVDAVETVRLFHDIVLAAAQHPERWAFVEQGGGGGGGGLSILRDIKVRFGIMPGSYDQDEPGIDIADVTEGGSAQVAGVEAGDRLVRWDGKKIESVRGWMEMLVEHEPGEVVKIGIIRDGEEITLDVTLQARETSG